jgi:hypothetical protein
MILEDDVKALLQPAQLRVIHNRMRGAAEHLRFPFARRVWRGQQGSFQGAGAGSSIDFQDHRPYALGDDIRHINWQAYARTGHYIIKLYREEVRPSVDLLVDLTGSMFLDAAKARRALELLYFAVENALRAEASLRIYLMEGQPRPRVWQTQQLLGYQLPPVEVDAAERPAAPVPLAEQLRSVPLRQGAMRIFLSDLLFPEPPAKVLARLVAANGRALVFAPFTKEEAEPGWEGTVEFEDVESGRKRLQRTPADLVDRYRKTYSRHFELWKEVARGYDIPLARVAAQMDFLPAMQVEALRIGAIELSH